MTVNPRARRQRALWRGSLLWLLSFTLLSFWWPRGPEHRLTGISFGDYLGTTSQGTLVAGRFVTTNPPPGTPVPAFQPVTRTLAGPIICVDLPTGRTRSIDLPDLTFAGQSTVTSSEIGESPWQVEMSSLVADSIVVVMKKNSGARRLHVWDPRSGEEVLRRDYPEGQFGFWHTRLWFALRSTPGQNTGATPSDSDPPACQVTLIDISSGRESPTGLSCIDLHTSQFDTSPDDRFAVSAQGSDLRAWKVDSGIEVLRTTATWFAFSANSRWLATVERRSGRMEEPQRIMRVFDLATGGVLAERVESLANRIPTTDTGIAFHDQDRRVVLGEGDHVYDPFHDPDSPQLTSVSSWAWEVGSGKQDDLTIAPKEGLRVLGPRYVRMPRLIQTRNEVLDSATGARTGTLPASYRSRSSSAESPPRWIIANVPDGPWGRLQKTVWRLIRGSTPFSWAAHSTWVYDLQTGKSHGPVAADSYLLEFSPDGRWLFAPNGDSIDVWRLPPASPLPWVIAVSSLLALACAVWSRWRTSRSTRVSVNSTPSARTHGVAESVSNSSAPP